MPTNLASSLLQHERATCGKRVINAKTATEQTATATATTTVLHCHLRCRMWQAEVLLLLLLLLFFADNILMKTVSCTLPVCLFICLRVCECVCMCVVCVFVCGTPTCSSSCFVKCEFNTCDLTFLGELRQLRRNLHKLRIRPPFSPATSGCHIAIHHFRLQQQLHSAVH